MAERLEPITLDDYDTLDDDHRREIEVVEGTALRREYRDRVHQKIAFRLAQALEDEHSPDLEVNTQFDVVLWDDPLTLRTPDVVVHRPLDGSAERLTPRDLVIVAEVVSPWSESRDRIHKMGEYAKAGIPNYQIADFDATGALTVEHYSLPPGERTYSRVSVTHAEFVSRGRALG
jgi:Uma2 family endonuclease